MTERKKLDRNEVRVAIEAFIKKQKRLPKTSEIAEKFGVSPREIQPHFMGFMKTIQRLHILPGGIIRHENGEAVWAQNTAGSMNLARFRTDKHNGHIISP